MTSFAWCSSSGEAQCLEKKLSEMEIDCKWINASGISHAVQILEEAEDGLYCQFDFLEINACDGGCLGGPLTVIPYPVAEATLRRTKKYSAYQEKFLMQIQCQCLIHFVQVDQHLQILR